MLFGDKSESPLPALSLQSSPNKDFKAYCGEARDSDLVWFLYHLEKERRQIAMPPSIQVLVMKTFEDVATTKSVDGIDCALTRLLLVWLACFSPLERELTLPSPSL